ncbi:MAG: DUF885 domain-containing protein [candidate division Zixibacteria bacterium]|nr:DUF885 domain-containing protein [candidate division Zixibacteria bacterium]
MRFIKFITALLLAICFTLTVNAAKKKQTFDEFSLKILESVQSFYPVKATEMGIHAYDHRFADYSSKSVKNRIKDLKSFEKKLYNFKKTNLSPHQQINVKLLKSNLDIELLNLKNIAWHKKSPQLYSQEIIDGLYFLMISTHAPMKEKIFSIMERMKAVPAYLKKAQKNIKNPPPVYIETAQEQIESAINFYKTAAGKLMNKFPDKADKILKISTKAQEALNDFSIFLSEISPGKETSFAIGKKNFDYMLANQNLLPYDSDSLLKIGEQLLSESQKKYKDYKKYVENNHQNGLDSVYIPNVFTKDDILNYYNWETKQVAIFIEQNNIVTIPDEIGDVEVIETPAFLRTMVTGIAYQPAGPFNEVQKAYFYVRPIPDDLDRRQLEARYRYVHRRGFKGSVVHEAYPGHHLMFQIASLNEDPVRKWQMDMQMAEGWALYSEEMMYKLGLYGKEDPAHWLQVLGGIRFRAARIIADVKLHTGQFTIEQCYDWMVEQLDIETESGKNYIKGEVRRYSFQPTYQMSYLIGKQEILKLRKSMKNKLGTQFSLQKFHDDLLSEGAIPPSLMYEIWDLK